MKVTSNPSTIIQTQQMSSKLQTTETKQELKREETPTMVIAAPPNYERTHTLTDCPLCHSLKPRLEMYVPERYLRYFDICLYTCCGTVCNCAFGSDTDLITNKVTIKPLNHKFSAKHEILTDAEHLKIYDKTHIRDVW